MYTSDIDLQNKSYNSHNPLKNERKESLMDSDFVAEQSTIAACFVHSQSFPQFHYRMAHFRFSAHGFFFLSGVTTSPSSGIFSSMNSINLQTTTNYKHQNQK